MSPSEFDLRAALREGEGEGVDAGPLIARGNRIRRDRRRRINNVIGVAAVVGVLGTAGTFLATRSSNEEAGGGAALSASRPPTHGGRADLRTAGAAPGAAYSARASTLPVPAGTANGLRACPPTPVHTERPGSVSAADDTLFPADVASIAACAYPASGTAVSGAVVTGSAAQSFARSLESAPSQPAVRHGRCYAPFDGTGTVQLRVYNSNGEMAAPLTVAPDCNQARVTNGTVTRYATQLPPPLPGLLRAVR